MDTNALSGHYPEGVPTFSVESPVHPRERPQSFIFYIVAKLNGLYRPLAVAQRLTGRRTDHGYGPKDVEQCACVGADLVRTCLRLVTSLSDPANRTAIQGELDLAAGAFARRDLSAPREPLEKFSRWFSAPHEMTFRELRRRPWTKSLRDFPFISTCLFLGISCDFAHGLRYKNVWHESLGLSFDDETLEYGMVVIDITDLKHVTYGIVGFHILRMVELQEGTIWPPVDDSGPFIDIETHTEPRPEPFRLRRPMSATGYMGKFGYEAQDEYEKDCVRILEEFSLVDAAALDACWPDDKCDADWTPSKPPRQSADRSVRSLKDQSMIQLVESLLNPQRASNGVQMSKLGESMRKIPGLQEAFRQELVLRADHLYHSGQAGQLLKIAFANQRHLNWVIFPSIPVKDFANALASDDLVDAKSISLCIDTVVGSLQDLAQALIRSSARFKEIYIHQEPHRPDDAASIRFLHHLMTASGIHKLLQYKPRLMISGAFSAALRHEMWLSLQAVDSSPLLEAFPLQHIFVASPKTITDDADNHSTHAPPRWPQHYSLRDALLPPQRAATGFLAFLAALLVDVAWWTRNDPLPFMACAAPNLAEMSFRDDRRVEISALPAENNAIPTWPVRKGYQIEDVECWPLVRKLVPGSWSVVVAVEKMCEESRRGVKMLRYAFLRHRVALEIMDLEDVESFHIGAEEVDVVGGLGAFVRCAAPGVDAAIVQQKLQELETFISHARGQNAPPSSVGKWVREMEPEEARELLTEFLYDAAEYGRRMLRIAMEERPESRKWYPELLQESKKPTPPTTGKITRASKTLTCYYNPTDDDVSDDNSDMVERYPYED